MTEQLKNRIMRRVYLIYYFRKLTQAPYLKVYALFLWLGILTLATSINNILGNMMAAGEGGVGKLSYFYKYAFVQTDFLVQAMTVFLILTAVWIGWGILKASVSRLLDAKSYFLKTR